MATKPEPPEVTLAKDIAGFTHDPLGYARYCWPWPEGTGIRDWQADVLDTIGKRLRDPVTRYQPIRIARASGHGIGKSALISMITKWGLDTCDDCRIVITANTETQLLTKTAPEITKWSNAAITADWFRPTATALISTQPGHEKSWRADLVTWSVNNTEAFAGLHNQGRRIILIFDEASGIDPKVWEVALGALTDENTEIIFLAFGNPTQNTGSFRACFGRHRALWDAAQIDSRTVEGTNKAYLDELVKTYGLDSDIVRVRVLGQFPSASSMQFIGNDLVQAARERDAEWIRSDPVIFGVDIARFGDDHSTLAIRQGRDAKTRPWRRWHGVDTMTLAGDIALEAEKWKPDAIFVDVGAMGAGVVDRLRQLAVKNVFEVNFGGKGRDTEWSAGVRIRTANKRAEMWSSMRAWLAIGAIPDEQAIEDDLTGVEYGYNASQAIQLEKKEHMRARGLASPDDADALACTFAQPVQPRDVPGYLNPENYGRGQDEDRYAEL